MRITSFGMCSKTSRTALDKLGCEIVFMTAAIASSKFSSPPSALSVLAPSARYFLNAFLSLYVVGKLPLSAFQAAK